MGGPPVPAGTLVHDDGLISARHAALDEASSTAYLGWLIVEVHRPAVCGLGDLDDREAAALGRALAHLSRALIATQGAEHVYLFVMGHHQPELHLHLIPRYPGAPREYWGVHVDEWPDAPRGDIEAVRRVCARLRDFMAAANPPDQHA